MQDDGAVFECPHVGVQALPLVRDQDDVTRGDERRWKMALVRRQVREPVKPLLLERVAERFEQSHAVGVGVEPVEIVEDDRLVAALPQLTIETERLHVSFDVERRSPGSLYVVGREIGHRQGTFDAFTLARAVASQQKNQSQFIGGKLGQIPFQLHVGRQRNYFTRHGRWGTPRLHSRWPPGETTNT